MCVCVCQHFYWILFALQQLRHKSLHHYEFLLPCPIDSHCASLKGARRGKEERERGRGKGAVFVCRVLFMCFLHIFPQCKPSGFMEISQMPLARLWPTGRGTLTPSLDALSGNLSDRLLLLHLLHPSLTDLKLQLAGLLRFPRPPSSAQCKQFSVLLIEMAKWRM